MDKLVNKVIDNDLNALDVQKICFNKYKVLLYSDLINYKNINEVLGKYNGTIILFQNTKLTGHWCCIWYNNDKTIHFFDPYGFEIDTQLNLATYVKKKYLSDLFNKSGCHIDFNKYELQKFTKNINTCGRWCGLRLRFRYLSHKKFYELFTKNKYYSPDFWVSALTMLINDDDNRDAELVKLLN